MAIQSGTWKELPPAEQILERIEEHKRHNADLTSYLWYIIPIAELLGNDVYKVAARSLAESGLDVDAQQLERLGEELKTPEGMARYATERHLHVFRNVTG